jgi:hypothetical protein
MRKMKGNVESIEHSKCQACGNDSKDVGLYHFANRWWLVCDKQKCLEKAISDCIDTLRYRIL